MKLTIVDGNARLGRGIGIGRAVGGRIARGLRRILRSVLHGDLVVDTKFTFGHTGEITLHGHASGHVRT